MTYTYHLEKLSDEPIMVGQVGPEFSVSAHSDELNQRILQWLESATENFFFILDVTEAALGFDDIVLGASKGTRSATPVLRHANMRQLVVVSHSALVRLAAKGLSAPIFGKVNVKVCDTRDEALAHCRAELTA
ncbi:MAG: hypothetical protein DYG88_12005 [Chloroflexi bacterium CFX4]|nr:hypothetical protein [Chloroflexi bacterium CFX4]MDL1923098.1 hypothetical protein [Chloroflexi bacterium CFX3]